MAQKKLSDLGHLGSKDEATREPPTTYVVYCKQGTEGFTFDVPPVLSFGKHDVYLFLGDVVISHQVELVPNDFLRNQDFKIRCEAVVEVTHELAPAAARSIQHYGNLSEAFSAHVTSAIESLALSEKESVVSLALFKENTVKFAIVEGARKAGLHVRQVAFAPRVSRSAVDVIEEIGAEAAVLDSNTKAGLTYRCHLVADQKNLPDFYTDSRTPEDLQVLVRNTIHSTVSNRYRLQQHENESEEIQAEVLRRISGALTRNKTGYAVEHLHFKTDKYKPPQTSQPLNFEASYSVRGFDGRIAIKHSGRISKTDSGLYEKSGAGDIQLIIENEIKSITQQYIDKRSYGEIITEFLPDGNGEENVRGEIDNGINRFIEGYGHQVDQILALIQNVPEFSYHVGKEDIVPKRAYPLARASMEPELTITIKTKVHNLEKLSRHLHTNTIDELVTSATANVVSRFLASTAPEKFYRSDIVSPAGAIENLKPDILKAVDDALAEEYGMSALSIAFAGTAEDPLAKRMREILEERIAVPIEGEVLSDTDGTLKKITISVNLTIDGPSPSEQDWRKFQNRALNVDLKQQIEDIEDQLNKTFQKLVAGYSYEAFAERLFHKHIEPKLRERIVGTMREEFGMEVRLGNDSITIERETAPVPLLSEIRAAITTLETEKIKARIKYAADDPQEAAAVVKAYDEQIAELKTQLQSAQEELHADNWDGSTFERLADERLRKQLPPPEQPIDPQE